MKRECRRGRRVVVSGKGYILKPRFFMICTVAMIMIFYAAFGAIASFAGNGQQGEMSYKAVVVQEGDTLWTIAERCTERKDIRKVVYEIRKTNDFPANYTIQPGETVLVPVDEEDIQAMEGGEKDE